MKAWALRWLKRAIAILSVMALLGAAVVVLGIVPITASSGHWGITRWFLHFAMRRSVATHSLFVEEPPSLEDRRLVVMGAGHYESGCRPCHGAPGTELPRIPHHMTPNPPRLASAAKRYDATELFYIVRHGIKLTGMPAWPAEHRDDEVWAMVAFVRKLPELDAEGYRDLVLGNAEAREAESRHASEAPRVVVVRCARCHGVDGLGRAVGSFPKLAGQRPGYIEASLTAYAKQQRASGIMGPIAAALEPHDRRVIADWYGAQPGGLAHAELRAEHGDELGARIAHDGLVDRDVPACITCHGPGSEPNHPRYPRLAGQYQPYLAQQLTLFTRAVRGGTPYSDVMETVAAHALDPKEIEAVTTYFARESKR